MMKPLIRRLAWTLALLLSLPLLCIPLILAIANTQSGRELMERMASTLSAGEITLTGLSGRFPEALRIGHIGLSDKDGVWLAIDNLALDWMPLHLLAGDVLIDRLEVKRIALERLPAFSDETKPSGETSLPVGISVRSLHVERLDMTEAVTGKAASLAIDGSARLAALDQGEIGVSLRRLDGEGTYTLKGRFDVATLHAQLSAQEPAHGLIASLAGMEELDAFSLEAALDGPLSGVRARLTLRLGPLHAAMEGELDFEHDNIAALAVTVTATAMRPRPDLSWKAIALEAKVQGPFSQPTTDGKLRVDNLSAATTTIQGISMALEGGAGQVQLRAKLDGICLPGPQPDLLKSAPVSIQAGVRLDAPERPVTFKMSHPLITLEGKAVTEGYQHAEFVLGLPDLQPLVALGGLDEKGKAALTLRAARQGDAVRLDVDGTLAFTGGGGALTKLLGGAAQFGASMALQSQDIALSRLRLKGKALDVSVDGGFAAQVANFNWKIMLNDLAAVLKKGSGRVAAQGRLTGPLDKFAVTADLKGELATKDLPRGPITAKLGLEGLPNSPSGQLTARCVLGGSPLELSLAAKAPSDGSIQLAIDRAEWKSAIAKGNLMLPKGASLPMGKIDLRMARLEDLRPLLDQPLSGIVTATLETAMQGGRPQGRFLIDARNAGLAGTALVEQINLDLTINDPIRSPILDGRIKLDGIASGTRTGSARLDLAGSVEALKLRLSAAIQNLAGAEIQLNSVAGIELKAKQAAVSELQAYWKNETLRLLAPVRIAFANGLILDRLRLGLRQAELDVAGRVTPTLDLTVALHNVTADLATLIVPDLAAAGMLRADAKLGGTLKRPTGIIEVEVADLQMRAGSARDLPPANLTATANLRGAFAHIDSHLSAGPNATMNISGEVPMDHSGLLDLRALGALDLKLLDPLLNAAGRRVHGQVALNAGFAGTLSEPRATGSIRLSNGEVQDYSVGGHLSDITALLEAEGSTIRIARFEGRAGPGKISIGGVVDLLAEGMPIDLAVTARNARPLAGDRLAVSLNTDLSVRGQAMGPLTAAGGIHINRAEIRIPERMPTNIAVLNVQRSDRPTPPTPSPPRDIALNLTIDAPRAIFVRGRGLDAELGGKIHVRGTAANPQPDGGFELRRGEFRLVGKTLTFNKGRVGFDGGSLADPSLDFVANTTSSNGTTTLTVGGTAGNPKITLNSVPNMPQDEILAQLLFSRSAGNLSPMEMVQIASALASLTGVTSGVGDPLEKVRKTLGLDRLSVGSTLEAGRYVSPGVYLGAKQGITGGNTQATVQIDITKKLKVEGSVGTASPSAASSGANTGANSVGVIYQTEY